MNTTELMTIAGSIVPDRDFMIFEGYRSTYEDTTQRINQLSQFFSQLSSGEPSCVGILSVNCPQYIESYFAAAKNGAIFVPLNFRAKAEELVYMINAAEIKVLVVGERYLDMVAEIIPELTTVEHYLAIDGSADKFVSYEESLAASPDEEMFLELDEDDTTILMFTSGTTGRPKAVPLTHNSFTSYILENVDPADPEMEESNILTVPLYHIAGIQAILAAVYGGRTLILMKQFDVVEWLETVQKERANRAMLVPTMIKQLIDYEKFGDYDLSSLQIITYGAAVMPFEVIKKAIELFPDASFINAFGQTETGSTIATLGPEDHDISGTEEEQRIKLKRLSSSIGKPLPDVEIQIIDELGKPVEANVVGEIVARGPRIMGGYWKDEVKTAQAFTPDGWLRTSDLGWLDEDGYIYLSGRADDLIIRGGENISPREIEEVLFGHPAVRDAAVFGIPSQEWGQEVMAVVVVNPDEPLSAEELIDFCKSKLSSFKSPSKLELVESLPRSALGKLSRKQLVQNYSKKDI